MLIDFKISNGMEPRTTFYVFGIFLFLIIFYALFFSAPQNFERKTIVKIEGGMSLRTVSSILEKQNIIRSRVAFEAFIIILGGEKHIISADYLFENKIPVFEVARRISKGEHHMPPVSVTIPEGFKADQIADAFASRLANFNREQFLLKAKEGYLFPDTYFFLTGADENDVLQSMNSNFEKKISPLRPEINSSGKTEKEIIIMASIIEGEAEGEADRAIISGILWKRLSIGMPLQVDAARETYQTKGLPKSPIGDPGLLAILAAIHPQSSPYLYYLHDQTGLIHYAKNFAEHTKNIVKYLKN